jgi:hypothetical protein
MVSKLILYHHLGLGDHFICNGIVHRLLELSVHEIWLPVKQRNQQCVTQLYSDYDQVKVIPVPELDQTQEIFSINHLSTQYNIPLLKVSFNGNGIQEFDRVFYEQLGLDLKDRWNYFKMPNDDSKALRFFDEHINPNDRYTLVHDTGSVGQFDLDIQTDYRIVKIEPGYTETLLDWRYVIQRASEIHCIDSSVIHLADSLRLDASKLVYHDVGRGSKFCLAHNWECKIYS